MSILQNHPCLVKEGWRYNRYGVPLHLTMVRGGFKNHFVIKHYKYGVIKTRWPDMSRIIASVQQRKCRNLFREAVAYAKMVIADPVRKAEWQRRIKRPNGVYNKAIKQYILEAKRQIEKWKEMEEINKLIRLAFSTKNRPQQKVASRKKEGTPKTQTRTTYADKVMTVFHGSSPPG